ncbi:hypothetical protein [Paraburkholderia silvatlantica]|uniref:hypothetical protein n=1 Tax=Paraburkholderia silvatlantica TaxID=321895 RepID=UPI003753CFA0
MAQINDTLTTMTTVTATTKPMTMTTPTTTTMTAVTTMDTKDNLGRKVTRTLTVAVTAARRTALRRTVGAMRTRRPKARAARAGASKTWIARPRSA